MAAAKVKVARQKKRKAAKTRLPLYPNIWKRGYVHGTSKSRKEALQTQTVRLTKLLQEADSAKPPPAEKADSITEVSSKPSQKRPKAAPHPSDAFGTSVSSSLDHAAVHAFAVSQLSLLTDDLEEQMIPLRQPLPKDEAEEHSANLTEDKATLDTTGEEQNDITTTTTTNPLINEAAVTADNLTEDKATLDTTGEEQNDITTTTTNPLINEAAVTVDHANENGTKESAQTCSATQGTNNQVVVKTNISDSQECNQQDSIEIRDDSNVIEVLDDSDAEVVEVIDNSGDEAPEESDDEVVDMYASSQFSPRLAAQLSTDETDKVDKLLYAGGSPKEVLFMIGPHSVNRKSIERLRPGKWLNDEIMQFNITMCQQYDNSQRATGRRGNYFYRTSFMSFLLNIQDPQRGFQYQNVARWTKNVDIFEMDKLFIPIPELDHWTFIIVYMQERIIQYYDSLGSTNQYYVNSVLKYLVREHLDKKNQQLPQELPWQVHPESPPNYPKQDNNDDCGVFVCMGAQDTCFGNQRWTCSPKVADQCRRRLCLSISLGKIV